MPADPAAARRIEPWPFAIAALLAAMIGTSVGFYRIAAANPDGLVSPDAFQAGIAYADGLRDAQAAHARGWTLDVATEAAPGGVLVTARLRDDAGATLAIDRASLRRERPAEHGFDAPFPLRADAASGALAADVALPRPGRWRLALAVERDGLRVERRIDVSAP
jgi:nitrogen fixation protein FixH